ncbi:MAG: hypothetical protein FJ315_01790 [SAR202 cluster bacterium]|nr:hypothetical protein [SAR202 cluster bacterium]
MRKGGQYGVIVAQVSVHGEEFRVLSDLIAVNPAFSNNHKYSPINPIWLWADQGVTARPGNARPDYS